MKRLLLASVLVAAPLASVIGASAAAAAVMPRTPAQALLHQAQYWRDRGRPDIARQSLERLLLVEPGNTVARSRLHTLAPPPAADPARAQAKRQGPSLTGRGFRSLDGGDLDAAGSLFRAALAVDPRDANALGGLGLVQLKAERFDEAEDLLAKASGAAGDARWSTSLATARFYAALRKAQAARDTGDLDGADAIARRLAASGYSDDRLAVDLAADISRRRARQDQRAGLAAWDAGDAPAAEISFRSAVSRAPDDAWIRYGYASFLSAGRQPDKAEAVMRPLGSATSPEARYALALFLDGQGRPAEAADLMDAIAPVYRSADMRRFERQLACELAVSAARALGEVGRTRVAVAGLNRLAAEPDLSNGALSQLADGLFELGDAAGAAKVVDRVLAAPMSAPSDYEGAVSVLARSGQSIAAQALIAQLSAASGGAVARAQEDRLRARAALGAADWHSGRGELTTAINILRKQLAQTPDDPEALGALGRAYLAAGRTERAVQVFDALTKLRPKDEGAWRGLTAAALEARDLPTAQTALAHARALSPGDPTILLASAELDRAMGDHRAAATDLRTALYAHERARAGDLDGLLDPQIVRRTQASFASGVIAADTTDPTGDRLREQLDRTYDVVSPSLQPRLNWAHRSGEAGLSRLATAGGSLSGGGPIGPGRLDISVTGEHLNAGRMTPVGAAQFGVGPLAPAAGPTPKTAADGWTVEADYTADALRLGVGVVSFNGRPSKAIGEARWAPKLANGLQAEFAVSRRPVTDSLLAYAGMTDPRAALSWGQVSRTGGKGGLTLSRGDAGVYGVLSGYAYDGRHVRSNGSVQLDMGAYAQIFGGGTTKLKGGLNLDVQAYKRNENAFTYGHGGYFSPQQFVSLTVPLRLSSKAGSWQVEAQVSPGYQHYREGDAPVFPTASALQAALQPDQSMILGGRKQGLGVSGEARVEYAFGPRVLLGAEVGGDTFGAYREAHAGLRLRLRFAGAK